MKLGLRLPQRLGVDLQHDLVEVARTAEAAGYASLWTYERLLFPKTPAEPYAPPNVPWPETSRQAADPLTVLTAAAVVTEKVRLGSAVLVAALHTPVQLAKALATVDQISGGRMIAGMSTGWSTDELQATGATRADRGRFLDETLDVFDAVWGPDPVSFRGPRVVIDNASVLPKPVSKIPVMLGGGGSNLGRRTSSKAVQRIAKRADGWLPLLTTPGPAGAAKLRASWTVSSKWLLTTAGTRAGWRWSWWETSPSLTVRQDLTDPRSSALSTRLWTMSERPQRLAQTSSSWI
jgi:probable F420-dependent oxidoreductase